MNKRLIWVVVSLFILLIAYGRQTCAQEDTYDWALQPKEDGSMHVKVTVTLNHTPSQVYFVASEAVPIKNIKAWEAKTEKPIDISTDVVGDGIVYIVDIRGNRGMGFQCVVEFDQSDLVIGENGAYVFVWLFAPGEFAASHTVTVTLPYGHELFGAGPEPVNVSISRGVTVITFEQDIPAGGPLMLICAFSNKGFQLLQSAEDNFRANRYSEAKKDYLEAFNFYSTSDKIYGKDKGVLLAQLQVKIMECEDEEAKEFKKVADEKFAEAMAAFNSEDYDTAAQLFTEAQKLYTSAGDAAKMAECSDYVGQCTTLLQQLMDKADTLFNEGVSLFDQKKFSEAKAKFEEARAVYEKIENSEKVKMCEEKIALCEEKIEEGGICIGSSLISVIVAGAALSAWRVRKKQ